jgi:hypothetical protein
MAKSIAAVWYNKEKMAVVIREWLRKKALYTHHDEIFKIVPVLGQMQKCNRSMMLKNNDTGVEKSG